MLKTIINRLKRLEGRVIKGISIVDAWLKNHAQGLETDPVSGEGITLDELRRRFPEHAAQLEDRRSAVAETLGIFEDSDSPDESPE